VTDERLLVGLMCGTSGDGVSAALIATSGYGRDRRLRLLTHSVYPYPQQLRERLFALFPPQRFTAAELAHLHRELGEVLAEASLAIIAAGGHAVADLSAIAIQAPTLFHEPPDERSLGVHMEIGEAAVVSERTGAVVVGDLRPSDIAAGGHGAPLSAFVDYVLFADESLGRAVQNIGGIANVTFLPAGVTRDAVVCFDTGPGNMLIDGVIAILTNGREQFDQDGQRAARGSVNKPLLAELMQHPYLARRPPKTTGREDFGAHLAEKTVARAQGLGVRDDDLVATVTAFTVESIRLHYERELIPRARLDEIVIYGGGCHNRTLVRMLHEAFAPIPIRFHDQFGIPGDAREAVTWAVLADETLAGQPANLPAASGAGHSVVLGKIVSVHPGRGAWRAC
jgi:anhydro-N-acetylmuramic acid kinase